MTLQATILASGPDWYVQDVVCSAGPRDRPFEERHGSFTVAAVLSGTFRYRTPLGAALLAPGAVLLGNSGCCFECGHDHGVGDRCLSVHFEPGRWEDAVAAVPGARKTGFARPSVPAIPSLIPEIAAVQAAREMGAAALEEAALALAGAVIGIASELRQRPRSPSSRDERRISDALRRIEEHAHDADAGALSLGQLAADAGVSPCHFLRIFRELVGMTPYQYVLRCRMNRAAVNLRLSDMKISAIAYEAGFNDLSTFNRRFHAAMGRSPGAYRSYHRAL